MLRLLRDLLSPDHSEGGSAAWCERTLSDAVPARSAAALSHPGDSSQSSPACFSSPHAGSIAGLAARSRGAPTQRRLLIKLLQTSIQQQMDQPSLLYTLVDSFGPATLWR